MKSGSLIPLTGVEILPPPSPITATLPVTLSTAIQPDDATPNVSYIWLPVPISGQGSSPAVFAFERGGLQSVTVWAVQAGQSVSDTIMIDAAPMVRPFYLPLVYRP